MSPWLTVLGPAGFFVQLLVKHEFFLGEHRLCGLQTVRILCLSVQQPAVPSNILFPEVYLCGTVEEVMLSVFTNYIKSSCLKMLKGLKPWHKCCPKSQVPSPKSHLFPTGSHHWTWCQVWPSRARFRPLGCFVDRSTDCCAELPNCQARSCAPVAHWLRFSERVNKNRLIVKTSKLTTM